jgi:hypothetical protein
VDYAALEARWWAIVTQDLQNATAEHRKAVVEAMQAFDGFYGRATNLGDEIDRLRGEVEKMKEAADHHHTCLAADLQEWPDLPKPQKADLIAEAARETQKLTKYSRSPEEVRKAIEGNGNLSMRSGQGRILAVMVQRFPSKMTIAQIATLSKMKVTGGTFKTYWSRLKVAGYIEGEGNLWTASQAGIDAMGGNVPEPQSRGEIVEMWAQAVGGKAGDMLRALVGLYPSSYTRVNLAADVGLEVNGGTYKTYISRLRSNNLITTDGYEVRASDDLMA